MTEKQEASDDIRSISLKLQSISTSDAESRSPQDQASRGRSNPGMKRVPSPHASQDARSVNAVDESTPVRNLPELNIPERIVFVLDTVREPDCTHFKLGSGAVYAPLLMIKRAIEIFIGAKSTIERRHEFALMTLDSRAANWICDFTSNTKTILYCLEGIAEDTLEEKQEKYDLGEVFKEISARTPIVGDVLAPTTFVSRVVLIYGRSHCMPQFTSGAEELARLNGTPYFFLDSLFVHEAPTEENLCDEIYRALSSLDVGFSFILENGRNPAKLHDNMAKLMAHPLQRPLQKDACYTINSFLAAPEVHTKV